MPEVFTQPEPNPHQPTQPAMPVASPSGEPHKDRSFLHAFCEHPKNVSFSHQEPGEKVILLIRRHFITNIPWITTTLVLLALPFGVPLLFEVAGFSITAIPLPLLLISAGFYLLIIFGYALINFVTWYYNVGIVTPRRVIDIDFDDIRQREVAEIRIRGIVDVEFKQHGFLQSFFDFGDVFVQTEGIKPNFEFLSAPHPGKVVDLILDLKEQLRNGE